jgi:hypothetical protein
MLRRNGVNALPGTGGFCIFGDLLSAREHFTPAVRRRKPPDRRQGR